MIRNILGWGLIVVLLAGGILAVGLGHSARRHADRTAQPQPVLLWFGADGVVHIDERKSLLTHWQDNWRLALGLNSGVPVRVGADDGVAYALVEEALGEARRRGMPDIGYAVDRNGQALALSSLTPADVLPPPGPHVLSIEVDGRMALDDTPLDGRALGEWLKLSAAPGYPRGADTPVELKVDPAATYGSVRPVLAALAAGKPRRIADFEQGSALVRQLVPVPVEHPIPIPNCPQMSKFGCR
ncbi:hypothetical protein [Dyella sp. SG609]|uniref:ExbD/TolR family protein n=1 Tax=Dyella sp. SG609 TaxID=2587018 RepID=UPI001447A457|nr:hypothetical protein [Dyella sp. SG609]NKJ19687.1 biopolymer transport protein ExbD [Dyella sp. SG609]